MNDLILIFAVVAPTVALALWWALRPNAVSAAAGEEERVAAIVVRDDVIEHANNAAYAQLPIMMGAQTWADLRDILLPSYLRIPLQVLPAGTPDLTLSNSDCAHLPLGKLRICWQARGALIEIDLPDAPPEPDCNMAELEMLRQLADILPHPAWKTDAAGDLVWSNAAYHALVARLPAGASPAPLFSDQASDTDPANSRREIVLADSDDPLWYDIVRNPQADGTLYQATCLTELIQAEEAQRDFVQTLAKTFAQLSTGLAIFNRNRQLALFNPALLDLTGLNVSFLSPRPTIHAFFDALRENRRMPEPKNYRTWRHRIADLVSAAEVGRFEETWTLESGMTYRVTGRPHPDGAIAFLIEDISAEVSLTRNFRAELELGQSLVDTFEDALAVFSQNGIQTFSNKAYDLLWGFEGEAAFADVTISDAIRLWKEKSAPNPMWEDLQDSVMKLGDRAEWSMPVCLKGQMPMQCRIVPIASGATVVRFTRTPAAHPAPISQMEPTTP